MSVNDSENHSNYCPIVPINKTTKGIA